MFTHPEKNLKAFEIREDMTVADLGSGTGFYAIEAGKIAQRGRVYAIEIQQDFLETVRNKAKEAHLDNVECLRGNIEKIGGTKLEDNSIDRVIISNVFFQVEDKNSFIEETKRITKPGGKLLLLDHDPFVSHLGLKSILPKETVRGMFEKKGFSLDREIDAGSHHYGMIMIKK